MQDQRKVTSASAPDPDSGVFSFSHSFFAWMMFPVTRTYFEKGYFANEELRGKIKLGDGLWRPEEVVLGFEPELQTALRGHVSWRMDPLEPGLPMLRTVSVQELQVLMNPPGNYIYKSATM